MRTMGIYEHVEENAIFWYSAEKLCCDILPFDEINIPYGHRKYVAYD